MNQTINIEGYYLHYQVIASLWGRWRRDPKNKS